MAAAAPGRVQERWAAAMYHFRGAPLVWIALLKSGYVPFAQHLARDLARLGVPAPLTVSTPR